MKKTIACGVILLCMGAALFADDAKVMPAKTGRVYTAPTYSFAPAAYDTDGNYRKFSGGSVKLMNMGFALEYGALDWITAAVQWVPGWTPWSNIDAALSDEFDKANTNGFADIFAGAKIQLAGESAPLKTGMFRLAFAPGVIIPLPGPDFETEVRNFSLGESTTLSSMDKHVFAAGARTSFDFVLNKNFFINLYNETIFYPQKQDLEKDTFILSYAKAKTPAGTLDNVKGEVAYKYRLTFEVEPVFTVPITDGIYFTAGVPVNFRYSPAYDYSFSGGTQDQYDAISAQLNTGPQMNLGITPNLSIFFEKSLVPIELKFQYGFPLYGKNSPARHNATLQVRVYFAFGPR